jgi:hypothetical protein
MVLVIISCMKYANFEEYFQTHRTTDESDVSWMRATAGMSDIALKRAEENYLKQVTAKF